MNLKHYFNIYLVQLKNNWVREAVYRTNFLTAVMVDFVWIIVEFSLFKIIYSHVESLAGWSLEQIYFFLGIFFASDALFTIFFQRNFWTFSDLVNKGELDILLTKPVNSIFLALTRYINLTNIFNFALGMAIIFLYYKKAGFQGGIYWLSLGLWLIVGMLTQLLLRFFFSIWTFWTDRGWALSRLYYQFFAIGTKPHTLYPKLIRYTLLTALPFAFIGSIPATALLHGLESFQYAWIASVLIGFFLFNRILWRRGLLRYQSASS